MNPLRFLALGALLLATPWVHARYQIKGGAINALHVPPAPDWPPADPDGTPPVVTPQFAGIGATAASSGAIDSTPDDPLDDGSIPAEHYDRYPAGKQVDGVTVTGAIVLVRSSFGGVFASASSLAALSRSPAAWLACSSARV